MKKLTSKQRKEAFLIALEKSGGIVKPACDASGVHRQTYYSWLKNDAKFKAAAMECKEIQKDFVESKLLKAIKEDNLTAIIFFAKTQMKDRGYNEKQEIELSEKPAASIPIVVVKDNDESNTD